jgi:hypothetical protein
LRWERGWATDGKPVSVRVRVWIRAGGFGADELHWETQIPVSRSRRWRKVARGPGWKIGRD